MSATADFELTPERMDCLAAIQRGDVTCHVTAGGGTWFTDRRTGVAPWHVRPLVAAGLAKVTGGRRVRLTDAGRAVLDAHGGAR